MNRKFNICIIQPNGYIHFAVFLEIADLLTYSIRELGFEANTSFNNIDQSKINIIIGIHLVDFNSYIGQIPSTSIILNTEQLGGVFSDWNQNIIKWFESNLELWDYSDKNIKYLKQLGIKNVKKLNIGYQPELRNLVNNNDYEIDVLFYGCINERRKYILEELHNKGLKVKTLFGVYGKQRDQWIRHSKLVLNLHFYDTQIFEIVRVFYLQTNSVAVVGEVNNTTIIEQRFKDGVFAASYDKLVDSVISLVGDESKLKEQREIGFNSISKYPQVEFTKSLIF